MTLEIELLWPKRRIVEVYLNIIELGPGVYGAEAAARRYFARPAAKLSRRQAALLAAILPNPRTVVAGAAEPLSRGSRAHDRDPGRAARPDARLRPPRLRLAPAATCAKLRRRW